MKDIWAAQQCKKCKVDGVDGWECGHCGFQKKGRHHTRAVRHFAKQPGGGIQICKAVHTPEDAQVYEDLFNRFVARKNAKKRLNDEQTNFAETRQEVAVEALTAKRSKKGGGSGMDSYYPVTRVSSSIKTAGHPSNQPSIKASVQNLTQKVIRVSNNISLQMAIADFFHSENIPDHTAKSKRFAIMLRKARLFGDDFLIPDRNRIGGDLLDINYETCMNANKTMLLKEAPVFGLAWIGDGATIKRMPLVNVLAMCADVPPTVIAINDCTGHMSAGGKKDAPYIAEMFEDKVTEYDPDKTLTDIFFFDGTSNVQKAGRILTAKYPRSTSCHGGEHVLALFFEDLAKFPVVKVCHMILFSCQACVCF